MQKFDITRYVPSGIKRSLVFYSYVNPECSVIEGTEIRKIQDPEHGTIEIVPEEGFLSWSKDTVYYKCNEKKIRGFTLYYKSSEGYHGPDRFDLLILYPYGFAYEQHFTVNVQKEVASKPVEEPPPEVKPAPNPIANLKYALECGAAKSTPSDADPDPIYKTKIAVTDKVIYVVHYAASGETYIRNEQYRDQRFRVLEKTDYWTGVSIKRPDRTMVGTIRMDKRGQWAEYIEKLFMLGRARIAAPVSRKTCAG
jgi:hypothetical protein